MSSALREPLITEADVGFQWWFVKIYTHGFDGADPLIGDLLPPVVAEARSMGIERWFFIRYLDGHGPHIRLRVLGRRSVLDHLQRVHRQLEADLEGVLTKPVAEHTFIAPLDQRMYQGRSGRGVRASIYEPELEKYGGQCGLRLAEELFEFSSDLSLWACGRMPKSPNRAGLAALLLHDAVTALLEGPKSAEAGRRRIGWDEYWDRHLMWWTTDFGSRADAARSRMKQALAERSEQTQGLLEQARNLPGVEPWRNRWRLAMDSYLHRAGQSGTIDRSPQHLVFHQAHMMLNRLGFLPREEAVLGLHARTWRE